MKEIIIIMCTHLKNESFNHDQQVEKFYQLDNDNEVKLTIAFDVNLQTQNSPSASMIAMVREKLTLTISQTSCAH